MANRDTEIFHSKDPRQAMNNPRLEEPSASWMRKNFALPSGFQLTVDHKTYDLLHARETQENHGKIESTTSGVGLRDPPEVFPRLQNPMEKDSWCGSDCGSPVDDVVRKDPRWNLLVDESTYMLANAHLHEELQRAMESATATVEPQDGPSERPSETRGAEDSSKLQPKEKKKNAQSSKRKGEKKAPAGSNEQEPDDVGPPSHNDKVSLLDMRSVEEEIILINPVRCDFCNVSEAESSRYLITQTHVSCGDGKCTGFERRYTSCFQCMLFKFEARADDDEEASPGFDEPPSKMDATVALCDMCNTEMTSTECHFKRTQQPKQIDATSYDATESSRGLEANQTGRKSNVETSDAETSNVEPKYYRVCQTCNESYLPQCTAGVFTTQLRPIPKVDPPTPPSSTSQISSPSSSKGIPQRKTSSCSSAASGDMPPSGETHEGHESPPQMAMMTIMNEATVESEPSMQSEEEDKGQAKKRPISSVEETSVPGIITDMPPPESTVSRCIGKKTKREPSAGRQPVPKAEEFPVNSQVKMLATGPVASEILQENLDSTLMAQCMVLAHRISGPDSCDAFLAKWHMQHVIHKVNVLDPFLAQSHQEICERVLATTDEKNLDPHALAKMYKVVFIEAAARPMDKFKDAGRRAVAIVRRHGCAETQDNIDRLKFKAYSTEIIQEGPWKRTWDDALRGFRDVLKYKLERIRANPEIVPWQWVDSAASLETYGNVCKIEGTWLPYPRLTAAREAQNGWQSTMTLVSFVSEQRNGVVRGRLRVLLDVYDTCDRLDPIFHWPDATERWCFVAAEVNANTPTKVADDLFWKPDTQPDVPVGKPNRPRTFKIDSAAAMAKQEARAMEEEEKLPLDIFVVPEIPWQR